MSPHRFRHTVQARNARIGVCKRESTIPMDLCEAYSDRSREDKCLDEGQCPIMNLHDTRWPEKLFARKGRTTISFHKVALRSIIVTPANWVCNRRTKRTPKNPCPAFAARRQHSIGLRTTGSGDCGRGGQSLSQSETLDSLEVIGAIRRAGGVCSQQRLTIKHPVASRLPTPDVVA